MVSGQVYWYQLEAVDVQGGTQVVGSVNAEINSTAAPSKVWLPLVVTPVTFHHTHSRVATRVFDQASVWTLRCPLACEARGQLRLLPP